MAERFEISGIDGYSWRLQQEIHEISATAKYPLGTKLVEVGSGEIYRYAKTGEATCLTQRGAWSYDPQICAQAAIATTSIAGENHLHVTIGAADGIAGNGAIAADYLIGGRVVIWRAALTVLVYTITSNSVVLAGGGTMLVGVNGIFAAAITAGTEVVEIMGNPYRDVRTGNSNGNKMFVGQWKAPVVTASPYGWLLRRGLTFIDPQATVGTTNHNQVGFRHDGSIDAYADGSVYTARMQPAGYVASFTVAGTQAAPFIMLQLE